MLAGLSASPFAAFRVRSFRFQWPADLLTSWAFEMETLILGWYVLTATGSVLLLTVFGSLQFLGTLLAPLLGVIADRVGRRTMLCGLRAIYACLAAVLMGLGLSDLLTPYHVLAIAVLAGLVRPSDLVMRNSLIGDTIPANLLMNALSVARTTMDSARIAGALAGAGLFSLLGLGWAYVFVASFYALSLLLTLGVSGVPLDQEPAAPATQPVRPSSWADLKDGLRYVRATPQVLATMWLAFLVNLTAYPVSHGLLPYVAKEIYLVDENGLGHLLAAFSGGALIGSIALVLRNGARRPARFMLITVLIWYALLLVFGQMESKLAGLGLLLLMGAFQSFAMISMSVTLLSAVPQRYRARIMGVRMLAVYGLPVGLLASGVVIGWLGYAGTVVLYCAVGIAATALVGWRWRQNIWRS